MAFRLTEEDLKKFKRLCDEHGIKYATEEEYRQSAHSLVRLVEITGKPLPVSSKKQPPG